MIKARSIRPFILLLALSACGPLINLTPGGSPLTYYSLTPASTFESGLEALPIVLLVEQPVAPGALESARIALRPSPLEVQYYARVKWADRAPKMMQSLLVTSFENSKLVKSVGTEAMGLPADFRLKATLRDLQADYPARDAAPVIHVTLSVKLVRKSPMMTIDSKVIASSVQATRNKLPDIMAAFDKASREVLQETVDWSLATARKDVAAP